MYDLLIAGAGLAGLHVATQYLTHKGSVAEPPSTHKGQSVLMVERNTYLGGRIHTHHQTIPGKGRYQWEAGAGRIPTTHKRIIRLIQAYGLTFQHWSAPSNLVDKFPDLIPIYLEPLLALPAPVLAQNTLADLLKQIHGPSIRDFVQLFPYWAEFHTLRADVALQAFMDGPLGPNTRWGGCAEGLGELPKRMGEDIQARGGEIRLGTSVLEVRPVRGGMRVLLETDGKREWITAKKVVLALDVSSLRHVKGPTQHLPILCHLKQEPLLRVYAVFPTHKATSWFSGMAKQVVPGPIRFFIPMDASKGLAMISYTEGRDAMRWMDIKSVKEREKAMMKALRELYQDKEIPDPVMIKFHGWLTGCTYWVPGKYNTEEESDKSVQPLDGVPLYLCSESFAVQQSWMESALVQAEKVLALL
jgi:protoporphyrinogen oxidase